jgi:hypothetical protein
MLIRGPLCLFRIDTVGFDHCQRSFRRKGLSLLHGEGIVLMIELRFCNCQEPAAPAGQQL